MDKKLLAITILTIFGVNNIQAWWWSSTPQIVNDRLQQLDTTIADTPINSAEHYGALRAREDLIKNERPFRGKSLVVQQRLIELNEHEQNAFATMHANSNDQAAKQQLEGVTFATAALRWGSWLTGSKKPAVQEELVDANKDLEQSWPLYARGDNGSHSTSRALENERIYGRALAKYDAAFRKSGSWLYRIANWFFPVIKKSSAELPQQ